MTPERLDEIQKRADKYVEPIGTYVHDLIAEVRRLQAENERLKAEQWRLIETAPKDERLLLFIPSASEQSAVGFGRWDGDRWSKKPRPFWSRDGMQATWCRLHQPTHWAPLPPVPEGLT